MRSCMHDKALVFRKSLITRALAVAFGAASLAGGIHTTAFAQSNTTGTLYGTVAAAGAGATIVLTNKDNGAHRTLTVDSTGRFNAQSLVTGNYKVELMVGGKVSKTSDNVEVRVGQGTEVSFSTSLEAVQVLALRQKIDVASIGSTTVFTAGDLAKVPVASNVGAVIQLAPNTTRGDARYGGANAPSFGGAGASENAYYINGFPVTTMLTQLGFSQLPFNSIAQAQVLTGGYGAEFGRSTGGVVNIVTKSGGNEWVAGAAVSIEPNSLRSKTKNQYYEPVGTALDGKIYFYNDGNELSRTSESFYLGGPLIKDKLFMFLSGEQTKTTSSGIRQANTTVAGTNLVGGWQEQTTETPRYLLKLDWNLNDANHLEYTRISDKVVNHRTYSGFNYATMTRNNVASGGADYLNWGPTPTAAAQGSVTDIVKYTGYLTDDLIVTALLGKSYSPHEFNPIGYNATLARALSDSSVQIPGFSYPNPQTTTASLLTPGAYDQNKGARLDVEYKLNSAHNIRAGVDRNTITSKSGNTYPGPDGGIWQYGKTSPTDTQSGHYAAPNTVAGNTYAQQGYIVEKIIFSAVATPTVDQSAWYIEDKYKVTDNVLLSLGLRNEAFNNKNGDGLSYINLPTQLAPRFGASWDINGDASTKVFASAGRYHVPLPTNVAIRAAGSSLYTTQRFAYTGVDPVTGAPTGLTSLGNPYSSNNEYGQAKDPLQVAAQDMKGNFQDEYAIGFEKALSKGLNVGGKFTYRNLRTAIDDHCDDRPFMAWAARNGVDTTNFAGYNCALFNPGIANTFNIDMNGDGTLERVALSAADLGIPEVKRKYLAIDVFAEHPFDGKWWGKATYTWSRNWGNTEGQLLSDIAQADVATTQAYDFPEFSVGADGLLPNDRTHQVKLFGYYQADPEWGIGGNMLIASGRPRNCIGNAPSTTGDFFGTPSQITNYSGYGSAYFFCNGVYAPRGSFGNLPMDFRVDMNVSYKPAALKGFGFKLDIFNFFNRQSIEVIEERMYNRNATTTLATYSSVQSYTAPRYVKLTASYDYKF